MNLQQPKMTRRKFVSSLAGGLVVGFFLPTGGRIAGLLGEAEADAADLLPEGVTSATTTINAWVRITNRGKAQLLFGGCEMGQGTMTGLCQLLAEELKVSWTQVLVMRPDTSENPNSPVTPYPSTTLEKQSFRYLTGGSSGISRRWLPLRIAGAQARELLVASVVMAAGSVLGSKPRYASAANWLAARA